MGSDEDLPESVAESIAVAFDSLSESRRVHTVRYLSEFDVGAEISLRTIAKTVASQERGKPPEKVEYAEYKSVRGALHRWHLPSLDQCGVIGYDEERSIAKVQPELRFYGATLALVEFWIRHE